MSRAYEPLLCAYDGMGKLHVGSSSRLPPDPRIAGPSSARMVSAIPYVMKSQMGMEIDYNVTNHCYRGLLRYEADAYDQGPPQSHAEDPGVFRVCTAASGELGEAPVFDKLSNVLLGKETVDSLEKALVTPTASSPPRAGAFVRYDSVGHVISRAVRVPAFDDTSYGSDPCPLGLEIGSKANGQFVVSLCGDVICRTDKVETFTVTASSGATVIGGTLKVANALAGSSTPPKLTVEAETANLVITKGGAGAGGGDRDVFKVEAATGTVTAQGEMLAQSFIALSDKRLKQNIVKLESGRALDVVASLRPTTYQMKNEPGDERCGLVAQEVATVLPACVKPHPGGVLPADEDDEERKKQPDVLGVNYTDIIGYLIGSIHELSRRVDALARVPPSSSAPSADGRDSAAPPPPSEDDEDADGG